MELLKSFKALIREKDLFLPNDKLMLAVSGGVDSVVLCELCKQAGYDFTIVHCNFQLRGEESERDEQFVRQLGEKYDVGVQVKKFDTQSYAAEKKIAIQEAARELRYNWFFDILYKTYYSPGAGNNNAGESTVPGWHVIENRTLVVTAHHADDNIETVLMNFCRGTGLHGLTGIPIAGSAKGKWTIYTSYLRRPLLIFSKEELIHFAKENNLAFVEDYSNQSLKYTRNFFRNEIIPAISSIYPQVKENLRDNIERFKEIEKLYQFSVGEIRKKLCKQKGDEVHIPVRQLMQFESRALIFEIITDFGFSEKQIDEVIKLAASDSGKYIQSPGNDHRIIKHRHWFIITSVNPEHSENIIIEEGIKEIQFAMGSLHIATIDIAGFQLPTANSEASLDVKRIQFPLLLRKWKTGDYFYPLGMKKKKKLARFFIDHKLSKADKEKAWVIEMNKKIIWVVGHRIDDRFKITGGTQQILQLKLGQGDQRQ